MSLGTQEERTEGMKRQAQELIDQAYQKGSKAGYEEGFKNGFDEGVSHPDINIIEEWIDKGRSEAWEAARTIIDFWFNVAHCDPNNFAKLFGIDAHLGDHVFEKLFEQFTASEAIEKLRAYEEQKDAEIKVGDEVYLIDKNHTRVVTCIFCENGDYKKAVQITESGKWVVDKISELQKTGRHFDAIEEVLKKMQEDTSK